MPGEWKFQPVTLDEITKEFHPVLPDEATLSPLTPVTPEEAMLIAQPREFDPKQQYNAQMISLIGKFICDVIQTLNSNTSEEETP